MVRVNAACVACIWCVSGACCFSEALVTRVECDRGTSVVSKWHVNGAFVTRMGLVSTLIKRVWFVSDPSEAISWRLRSFNGAFVTLQLNDAIVARL